MLLLFNKNENIINIKYNELFFLFKLSSFFEGVHRVTGYEKSICIDKANEPQLIRSI